jgi:hypothetical protein
VLWHIRELDVLAFLLAVFIKVAVEVRSMFLASLTLTAALLISTLDILPLVMPDMP